MFRAANQQYVEVHLLEYVFPWYRWMNYFPHLCHEHLAYPSYPRYEEFLVTNPNSTNSCILIYHSEENKCIRLIVTKTLMLAKVDVRCQQASRSPGGQDKFPVLEYPHIREVYPSISL